MIAHAPAFSFSQFTTLILLVLNLGLLLYYYGLRADVTTIGHICKA